MRTVALILTVLMFPASPRAQIGNPERTEADSSIQPADAKSTPRFHGFDLFSFLQGAGRTLAQPTSEQTPDCGEVAGGPESVLDLLVAYDDTVLAARGSPSDAKKHIEDLVEAANCIYKTSGVNVRLNLARTLHLEDYRPVLKVDDIPQHERSSLLEHEHHFTLMSLCDLTCGENGGEAVRAAMDDIDIAVLLRSPPDDPESTPVHCGMAWVFGEGKRGAHSADKVAESSMYGFAVVSEGKYRDGRARSDCRGNEHLFAHEVGHLLGAWHAKIRSRIGCNTAFSCSGAYGFARAFEGLGWGTVMASLSHNREQMPAASNTESRCPTCACTDSCAGPAPLTSCGRNSRNNACAMNAVRNVVATYSEKRPTHPRAVEDMIRYDLYSRATRCRKRVNRCVIPSPPEPMPPERN